MALLPIYNCYHALLKKKTQPVTEIDDELRKLVDDMYDTMHIAEGIGLAANQVGVSKSIITIDIHYFKKELDYTPVTLINPVIEWFSEETEDFEEGCLSVPTLHEIVSRSKQIRVRYKDLDLQEQVLEADGLLARVTQHEIDHLNGILFYERITPIRRTLAKSKLKKIQKGAITADYPRILPDGRLVK